MVVRSPFKRPDDISGGRARGRLRRPTRPRLATGLAAVASLGTWGLVGLTTTPATAAPTTVYVTAGGTGKCGSDSASNGLPTLSDAVSCASSGDTISVGAGTFPGSVVLGTQPGSGVPITLTVEGAGAGRTTITEPAKAPAIGTPIFRIFPHATVTVKDLTVDGADHGSGIDGTTGTLVVDAVQVLHTVPWVTSGGPPDAFGAIGLEPPAGAAADLTVTGTTVADNQGLAGFGPGGITLDSQASPASTATLVNDTVTTSGNAVVGFGAGAGVVLYGTNASLVDDTIDANRGSLYSGGLYAGYNPAHSAPTTVSVANSIIAANPSDDSMLPPDCLQSQPGVVVNKGHNLVGADIGVNAGHALFGGFGYGCGLAGAAGGDLSGTIASLTSALGGGAVPTTLTSLPVSPLLRDIPAGASLVLAGTTPQVLTTTQAAPAGATSIAVQAFDPGFASSGTLVVYELPVGLGPLAQNGGPTQTQALLPASPAIGTGSTTACNSALVKGLDQRGDPRNASARGACDIGAYDTGGTDNSTVYVSSGGTGTCAANSSANGLATLAAAVACAVSGDTISIGPGTFGGGVTLPPGRFTLQGAGAGLTTIANSTVLGQLGTPEVDVAPDANVTVKELTVEGGDVNSGIDGTSGTLDIDAVQVRHTVPFASIGTIDSFGAIGLEPPPGSVADLTVTDTTVADNQNFSGDGPAGVTLYSRASPASQATLVNDTVTASGNTGPAIGSGAGVVLYGANATVVNDTIDANQGQLYPGGLYAGFDPATSAPTQVTVANTVVAANTATDPVVAPDCLQSQPGVIVNGGHDLIGADVSATTGGAVFGGTGYGCGLGNGAVGGISGTITALSAAPSGANVTALPVAPLQEAIPAGASLALDGAAQTVTTTQAAAVGATSIAVQAFTPNGNEPAGSLVVYQLAPQLGPLTDNGGPTETQALLPGSPAIGNGSAAICSSAPVNGLDQRGDTRNAAGRGSCDIGAYDTGGTASGSPVAVGTTTLPPGTVGQSYSATLTATAGTTPYTWSLADGTRLPSGLVLDPSNGAVSGTPTAPGTTRFTVEVADSTRPVAGTATAQLSITVAAAPTWAPGPSGPSARSGAAMATNPAGLTVLFGGGGAGSTAFSDTWELASASGPWQQLTQTAGTSPTGRTLASLVWAPSISKFVLFGGLNRSGFQGGTYTFDPATATWAALATTGAPPARAGAAMATLPNGDIVLFGGYGWTGFLSDTWVFDPATSTWTKQAGSGPSARYEAVIAGSPSGAVLFGGLGPSGLAGGTWSFDSASGNWSVVSTSGTSPAPRYGASFAYDNTDGRFVLFGGDTATGHSAATYTYAPATSTWAVLSPAVSPPARAGAALSFDAAARTFVLSGGWDGTKFHSGTWEIAG